MIAATLYQSLMSHMGSSQNKKVRKPRNENGVSCISIASSSVGGNGRNGNFGSVNQMVPLRQLESYKQTSSLYPPRPPRHKKRSASSSLSGHSDIVPDECIRTYDDAGKKKSHKTKRAPPIPSSTEGMLDTLKKVFMLRAHIFTLFLFTSRRLTKKAKQ